METYIEKSKVFPPYIFLLRSVKAFLLVYQKINILNYMVIILNKLVL